MEGGFWESVPIRPEKRRRDLCFSSVVVGRSVRDLVFVVIVVGCGFDLAAGPVTAVVLVPTMS